MYKSKWHFLLYTDVSSNIVAKCCHTSEHTDVSCIDVAVSVILPCTQLCDACLFTAMSNLVFLFCQNIVFFCFVCFSSFFRHCSVFLRVQHVVVLCLFDKLSGRV